MASTSTWEIHPDLAAALAAGQTFEEWLGDRCPVCSYARISRDLQRNDEKEIGVGRQHNNHCAPAADELGWAVVYQYTDNNIKASDPDITRPAFVQMVRDLRARRTEDGYPIKGVIAVEEERVVRLPEDYLRLYRALTVDEEGRLYYTDKKQLVDVYAEVEQTRGLMSSSMGETEVRKVKRRAKRSMRDRAGEGKNTGGPRRFGWLGKDARLGRKTNEVLDPTESKWLATCIDMADSGKAWNTIATWLISKAVPTVNGGAWSATGAKSMVLNPAWWGGRILNGELIRDPETGEPKIGGWEKLDPKSGYTYEKWKRIYDKARPADKLNGPRKKGAKRVRKHLGTGILRCGWVTDEDGETSLCLGRMVGRPPYGAHKWGNYVCNSTGCRRVSRRMDKIDAAITGIVVKTLEEQFSSLTPEEKTWHGQATLDSLVARRNELKDAYKGGAIDLGEYLEFKDHLDAQIKESQDDRSTFYEEQAAKNFLAGFSQHRWAEFDLKQKHTAIGTVLQAVIVHPIPKGRSRKAPFDPTLLEVVFKQPH
ncbi:recombinase family protein [Streptomyces chrestomyceticus]|uniref:recombinase family protein n=1 Tax=Streptomyces chrestomyceticus TaxID=68185 RepID=UPI0033C9ED45